MRRLLAEGEGEEEGQEVPIQRPRQIHRELRGAEIERTRNGALPQQGTNPTDRHVVDFICREVETSKCLRVHM